jgi:hypothetical protein
VEGIPLPESSDEELKRVIDAFLQLETTVGRMLAGELGLKTDALARVFALNTRIGRLAAMDVQRRGELRRLQLAVNGITLAIKRQDAVLLRESIDSVKEQLRGAVPG